MLQMAASTLDEAVADAAVVVIGKKVVGIDELKVAATGRTVIDLVGLPELGDVVRPGPHRRASPSLRR